MTNKINIKKPHIHNNICLWFEERLAEQLFTEDNLANTPPRLTRRAIDD